MINFEKIKLVIWDLDETFWRGTLSEGVVEPIDENITLIKTLTDRGIINSICSKNDKGLVDKTLRDMQLNDLFVFNSIDWTPKGKRISLLIKDMGLRPANVLFIDDNIQNLNEAKFYEPELMVEDPNSIKDLLDYFSRLPLSDSSHKRFIQYKILEEKRKSQKGFSDNISFLWSCNIRVTLHSDCMEQFDRIYELIQRTNQLNYTKNRCSKNELTTLLNDVSVHKGYVTVNDNFGDYGIVGFYALKDHSLIHFLFSCRTIGQGVEQYVYSSLNYPSLDVVGEVVNGVNMDPAPAWINQQVSSNKSLKSNKCKYKIVVKGPCDLGAITDYLRSDLVIHEMTYVGTEKHNLIEHQNHSVNYLQFPFLSDEERSYLLDICPFNDKKMFDTALFDSDTDFIFLSTLLEPNLGIYCHRRTRKKLAWGEWCYPLTDDKLWTSFVENKIYTADNNFNTEQLRRFKEDFEYIGRLTPVDYIENLKILMKRINPKAKVCLILGSEIPYEKNNQDAYVDRHQYHKELNTQIKEYSLTNDRVLIIDFNDFIKGQEDFTNNINHFQRRVYFQAAMNANEYLTAIFGQNMKEKQYKKMMDAMSKVLHKFIPSDTKLFLFLKAIYQRMRYGNKINRDGVVDNN